MKYRNRIQEQLFPVLRIVKIKIFMLVQKHLCLPSEDTYHKCINRINYFHLSGHLLAPPQKGSTSFV